MVFCERFVPAVVEVIEMQITEAEEVVPVALAAVLRFRTVFPVMVFVPEFEDIPITKLLVLAELGSSPLFRLATMLFVIEIVAELVFLIPVTATTLAPVYAPVLKLFAVDVLPTVLL